MQNDHDYRFLAAERVRELQQDVRSGHLADARLRLFLGIWLPKIRTALRRRSVDKEAQAVEVPSVCSGPVSCDD